jgi:hypothetical protein
MHDWEDYESFSQRPASAARPSRWILVGVDSDLAAYNKRRCPRTHSCFLKNILKDEPHWGPFVLQKQDAFGLDHYVSSQRLEPGKSIGAYDEVFYDAKTDQTIVTCSNIPAIPAPHERMSFCTLLFFIPELPASIEVSLSHPAKESMPKWREIEAAIRNVLRSFIIQ